MPTLVSQGIEKLGQYSVGGDQMTAVHGLGDLDSLSVVLV
jgi:hypothetical protein